MPAFRYIAIRQGARREGLLEAQSERAAAEILRREGASVLALAAAPAHPESGDGLRRLAWLWDRLTTRSQNVEVILRQMGALLHAGVPILTAANYKRNGTGV